MGSSELTIYPKPALKKDKASIVGVITWALFSSVFLLRFKGVLLYSLIALDLLIIFGGISLAVLSTKKSVLHATSETIEFQGVRKKRTVSVSQLASIEEVEVNWGVLSDRISHYWMMLDQSNNVCLGLNALAWAPDQLEELAAFIGLPVHTASKALPSKEVAREYHGSIPNWALHPIWIALTLGTVITAIALALQ
jgi:hypothetical protein